MCRIRGEKNNAILTLNIAMQVIRPGFSKKKFLTILLPRLPLIEPTRAWFSHKPFTLFSTLFWKNLQYLEAATSMDQIFFIERRRLISPSSYYYTGWRGLQLMA